MTDMITVAQFHDPVSTGRSRRTAWGLVLVRSYWRADVEVGPWEPRFEIRYRRLVPLAEAADHLREPDPAATRIHYRALHEAADNTTTG